MFLLQVGLALLAMLCLTLADPIPCGTVSPCGGSYRRGGFGGGRGRGGFNLKLSGALSIKKGGGGGGFRRGGGGGFRRGFGGGGV